MTFAASPSLCSQLYPRARPSALHLRAQPPLRRRAARSARGHDGFEAAEREKNAVEHVRSMGRGKAPDRALSTGGHERLARRQIINPPKGRNDDDYFSLN